MNLPTEQLRERMSLDEHGRGGQSDCARAMAEAEKVLRELALLTRRSKPEHSSPANEAPKAPSLIPAPSPIDRLVLDPGLDFVLHKDGIIELTEVGFRRMAQAHAAAIDVVIGIDSRDVLRFPARGAMGSMPYREKEITDLRALPGKHGLSDGRAAGGTVIGTRVSRHDQ
jgi:hypothetical protein